jgi:hypothetical protein
MEGRELVESSAVANQFSSGDAVRQATASEDLKP